ncbi:hypothetical protein Belba_1749 [Belliella baltica DSM 15883]|uniref:Uncharacterized protein n=1 Tax=Belliella baltica (strain DSM 15883 / CIP 108006 / LMG 21964 / BA134) TaxID=866536 RepID=I3Z533_BELBD|nr:hypothetical protein [Belliella baltica]AFL84351.1 hypothetical protein Belba_1749 [Belliella baltica DSM 15883]
MRKFLVFSLGLMSVLAFTTFIPEASQASSGGCMWSDRDFSCDPTFTDGHCALPDDCEVVVVTE